MLEIFFGWRKASRCKKLIRRVQCRLKLLKNKRCSIARQLRDDVAQLLKHGHEQNAFDRVEQIFLDESIVAVYDLLDHFCEFIVIHLSYIRKHKECPNDIGEAVSTLIFASARCGDLPELREIRELFGERYGRRFAAIALNLLPGNLVNCQIKDNLSIQSVTDDIKWTLVNEIWRSCPQTGPLAIEYYPEFQEEQAIRKPEDEEVTSDIQSKYTTNDKPQMEVFRITEEDGKIVYVDLPSDSKNLWTEYSTSSRSSTGINSSPSSFELPMNSYTNSPYRVKIMEKKEVDMGVGSSTSSSSQWPTESVYLDDIEEYKSPMSTHVNSQDQRLFMFKSSVIITTDKLESDFNKSCIDKKISSNEKSGSRRFRNSKRQRRRLFSRESTNVKDFESIIYYGERDENSRKSNHRRKHEKKIPIYELAKSRVAEFDNSLGAKTQKYDSKIQGVVHECNLMQPCYFCTSDDRDGLENQERKMILTKRISRHNQRSLYSIGSNKSFKETKAPDLRTMTTAPQRPTDRRDENMNPLQSFLFQQPKNKSPTCRHVHPKLPDYDQLAATFMALKKANSQIKSK